jgi:hypothetical protein
MIWFTGQRYPVALSCLDLDIAPTACTVVTVRRSGRQLDTIVVRRKRFTKAADQVTVWREVPPWKHRFKFVNRVINCAQQLRKAGTVHDRCTVSENGHAHRHWP